MDQPLVTDKHLRLQDAIHNPGITYAQPIMIYGPTQSSKTYVTAWMVLSWIADHFAGHNIILAARSLKQFNGVLGKYCEEFGEWSNLGWTPRKTFFMQRSRVGAPNEFHVLLGSNERQTQLAPGFASACAVIDEAPRMPEAFVRHVIARQTSVPGSKVLMLGNPEGPNHWCYRGFGCDAAGNELPEPRHFAFTPSDNPTLPESWSEDMRSVYLGHQYDRMVLGKHVAPTGAVYPNVGDAVGRAPKEEPLAYDIGVDYAEATVTHAVLFARFRGGQVWAVDEWTHDGRLEGQKDENAQSALLLAAIGNRPLRSIYVDPAALAFRNALTARASCPVIAADNDVEQGVQKVRQDMEDGALWFDRERCPQTIASMSGYRYDERLVSIGEEKPLKDGQEHGADAVRYRQWTVAVPSSANMGVTRVDAYQRERSRLRRTVSGRRS